MVPLINVLAWAVEELYWDGVPFHEAVDRAHRLIDGGGYATENKTKGRARGVGTL